MKKKVTDNFKKYQKGVTMEDLDGKLDLVLEHVSVMDRRLGVVEKDVKDIKTKVDLIEIKLVGKADVSRVERLEHRVTRLEV